MTHGGEAGPSRRYCGNCGAKVTPGDRFCGACGTRIAPITPEDPQVILQPVAAVQGADARSGRRSLVLVAVVGIVLALLVGGGLLAFGSVFTDAPPDPAFGPLLKPLRGRTDA